MNRIVLRHAVVALLLVLGVGRGLPLLAQEMPVFDIGRDEQMTLLAPAEWATETAGFPDTGSHPERLMEALQALPFQPLEASDTGRGITGQAHWLRFRIHNNSAIPQTWVLHGDTSYLDHLDIVYRDRSGPVADGESERFQRASLSDRVPFSDRPVSYRKLAFRHTTAPGEVTDVYLRAGYTKADSLSLMFTVQRERTFFRSVQSENLVFGAWYGVMFVLLIMAVVIGLVMRQPSALYYAAFLIATMAMWALLNGLGYQHLWPDNVYLQNEGFHVAFLLFSFFAFQFSRSFLRLDATLPVINRVMVVAQWAMVLAVVLRLAAGLYEPVLYFAYLSLIATLLLPVAGVLAWRAGLSHARWYIAAWVLYSGGLLLSVINAATGWLGRGMDGVLLVSQAGSFAEALLLMVAIGERVMQLERGRRTALEMAEQDPLTGLGNRRMLLSAYQRFRSAFRRNAIPVYLVMIDLDDFKAINDVYGHEAGDRVLVELAQLLRASSRSSDVCVRLGGDEFIMLLQAPDSGTVRDLVERIRRRFAGTPTEFRDHLIEHTFSAGVIIALDAGHDLVPADLLTGVDLALYDAKQEGRNRVELYERPAS
ncbi:MAG: diguanylate cyclase [Pseudohongiellaceae bacterium]